MTVNDIIVLPFTDKVIQKTITNTIKKFENTAPSLMYNRTPVEILDNIFMGDLAKNSLVEYLVAYAEKPIIDYDEIRTDNFINADPGWDFTLGEKKIKVEVKSSTPPNNESRADIIERRDVKITASHDKGLNWISPVNLESYIHVQVYFYAKPYRKGFDTISDLSEKLLKDPMSINKILNIEKYNEPLFFGWATKREIINYSKESENNTWTFSWTTRIYWKCPIKNAHNMNELIEVMNNN